MKIKITLLALLLTLSNSEASVKAKEQPVSNVPDLNKLKLNQEAFLTDTLGVVNVKAVSILQVGDNVRIYRTDGTMYTGTVTATEEEEGELKVYGKMNNAENTEFGFVLAKGGVFAGAIVDKKNAKTYALELSEAHKGYIFMITTKYDKPTA